jgi:hypothetical protein
MTCNKYLQIATNLKGHVALEEIHHDIAKQSMKVDFQITSVQRVHKVQFQQIGTIIVRSQRG